MKSEKAYFSKTGYIKGRQCLKALYLYKHFYSLKDPIPPERLKRFQLGSNFGVMARDLFPGGRDASPQHVHQYKESILLTKKLIQEGEKTIYEAAFIHEGVLVYCDILTKLESGWALYEVKSSTSVGNVYKEDLALQYFVVKGNGIDLIQAGIIHLNQTLPEDYQSQKINDLCAITDLTAYCHDELNKVEIEVVTMKKMLAKPSIPSIQMGTHCNSPYPCDFIGFCTQQATPLEEGLFRQ